MAKIVKKASDLSNDKWIVGNADDLHALCVELHDVGVSYQENVHRAVISCGFLLVEHNNYSVFNQLVQYLPDGGIRIDRMKDYIHFEFGAVWGEKKRSFRKDPEWGGTIQTVKDADDKDVLNVGVYREIKWYDYGKTPESKAFDTIKQLQGLTKKLRDNSDAVADQRVKAMGSAFDLVNQMDEMGLTTPEVKKVA